MSIHNKIRKMFFLLQKYWSDKKIMQTYVHKSKYLDYLSDTDFSRYEHNFYSALKCFGKDRNRQQIMSEIIRNFYSSHISQEKISFRASEVEADTPILISVIKNDISRSNLLFDYYRQLGIKNFVILDNNSDDGTFEWLMKQPDINLFRCTDNYQTYRKEAWVNRLISMCGFHRWYLIVDSDELVDYIGSEKYSIDQLVKKLQSKGYKRAKGMLIDMYSKENIFQSECSYEDIPKVFCHYDSTGYQFVEKSFVKHWEGGPRERELDTKHIWVSKSPLVYYDENTVVINAHFQFPLTVDADSPDVFFIRHYKYLKSDYKPFAARVTQGNFANGSEFYKKAISQFDQGKSTNFMYEGSKKYTTSEDIAGFYNITNMF